MTNRRIIIEYTLIEGKNNSFKNAKELAELLGELPCHINLIKLNEVDGRNLTAPTQDSCKTFLGYLNRLGLSATMRRSLGDDIEGACGQLRNKELRDNKVVVKENEFKPKTKPLPNKNTKNKVKDVSKLVQSKDRQKDYSKASEKSVSKADNKKSRVREKAPKHYAREKSSDARGRSFSKNTKSGNRRPSGR